MGKRIIKEIKIIIDGLLDIIYPPENKCITCGEEDHVGLCYKCNNKIKRITDNTGIISYAHYGGTIKKLILAFKYKKNFYAGEILSDYLCKLIKENKIEADIIFYVPISKESLKIRGFNQCEVMAKNISKKFNIPISKGLIKVRKTKEQKTLSKEERAENVIGAFDIKNPKDVKDKNIILIDDVVTTGETLKECEKILKKYEACTINILTVSKSNI
ncbi:ComF family protein [Clostridium carnis]